MFVNGSHFCDYDHRVDLRSVSHIYVDGDAKFSDVEFTAFFVSNNTTSLHLLLERFVDKISINVCCYW